MASKTSQVTEIHRFLDQKDGCSHKHLMSTDCSEHSLASFLAEDLLLTDEQYNELLHMLAKAKYLSFRLIDDFQGFCISDEFGPILAGCKRELADPGYRIPDLNITPDISDDGQGEDVGNAAGNVGAQPGNNNPNEAANIEAATGGDGGGGDGGGGGGGANNVYPPIVIYRYELDGQSMLIHKREVIPTNVVAYNCESWDDLAEKILTIWRQRNPRDYFEIPYLTTVNCWPGAETIFGHRSNDNFQSWTRATESGFGMYRRVINCLLVIENVNVDVSNGFGENANGDGPGITTWLYILRHHAMLMDMVSVSILPLPNRAAFVRWGDVGGVLYRRYLISHGFQPVNVAVDIADCWPGADTIFGRRVHDKFQSLSWQRYDWGEVAPQINCLLMFWYE